MKVEKKKGEKFMMSKQRKCSLYVLQGKLLRLSDESSEKRKCSEGETLQRSTSKYLKFKIQLYYFSKCTLIIDFCSTD